MLVIRNEQLTALADERLTEFERRLLPHCRQVVDTAGLAFDETALAGAVNRALRRGSRFFKVEHDLARYCEIVLLQLGGRTDLPDAANEMLQNDALTPEVRLRNFERWATHYRT
jgi:hypothetical protein